MTTLDKILILLKEQHKTQKQLMEYLGLGKTAFTGWRNGKNTSYKKHIDKIAEFFDVSTDYLLGRTESVDDKKSSSVFISLTPDPSPETQTLLVFNKNGIPDVHEKVLPSDDVLNEINKLVNALRPYPAKQINALLKIVENGGNIPLNPNLPPELKELVSIAANLSEDSLKALIQVAKTMK